MKPLNPSSMSTVLPKDHLQVVQSVHQVLSGNVDMGIGVGQDSSGVYNTFQKGNGSGVLIRIGASGTTQQPNVWTTSNTGIIINHGLFRQPIGFKIVDKDKAVDVYRTVTPDATQITLAPSDASANVTIYVF